jgi:hypothetical protein
MKRVGICCRDSPFVWAFDDVFSSASGLVCGQYHLNSGSSTAWMLYSCSSNAYNIEAFATPPPLTGVTLTTSPTTTSQTAPTTTFQAQPTGLPSESSGSDNSSSDDGSYLWIILGVIGAGVVALCGVIWWFCLRRNSWCRKRRQRSQTTYQKLEENTAGLPLDPDKNTTQITQNSVEMVPMMQSEHDSGPLTYRVEFIPSSTNSGEQVKQFFVDSTRVVVRSLAPTLSSKNQGTKTATIEYKAMMMQVVPGKKQPDPRLSREAQSLGIQVDDRFIGLTPLNTPQYPIIADVVAVTGLAGHAFGSWSHDRTHNWLRDYLPEDIRNLRVMTYGYESKLVEEGEEQSRQDLERHAGDFLRSLQRLWEKTNYQRPTILMGHSLGGLLIKYALIQSKTLERRPEALEKLVPLVVFFGTPHHGLQTTALELLVKGKYSQGFIEDMRPGSVTINHLDKKFREISTKIKILTIYETKPTPTAVRTKFGAERKGEPVMMVPEEKARLYFSNEESLSFHRDHKGVAKLLHGEDGPYNQVVANIESVLALPQTQRQPSVRR